MSRIVRVLRGRGIRVVIEQPVCDCRYRLPVGIRLADGERVHRVEVCPYCERLHGYERIRKGRLLRLEAAQLWALPHLTKALELKAGQRWITLHPNPEDPDHYVHVLIQEHPDGTASVIRGAAGRLNYLRLTRLKSPQEWQTAAQELAKQRERRRREALAAMSPEERTAAKKLRQAVLERKDMEDAKFVATVMEAHGVPREEWQLDEEVLASLPAKSRELAERRHLRKMVTVAHDLVDQTRKQLLEAHDLLAQSRLGDLPLGDVGADRPPEGKGAGYVAAVRATAEAAGLTITQELTEDISWRGFLDRSDGDIVKAARKQAAVERLHQALSAVQAPVTELKEAGLLDRPLKPTAPPPERIGDLLVAQRQQRELESQYRHVKSELETPVVPKALLRGVAELTPQEARKFAQESVSGMTDEQARERLAQELAEDAMQRAAERMLTAVDEEEAVQPLRKYVDLGHYDALNRAYLAATRSPLPLPRLSADILGPDASATLAAAYLAQTLPANEYAAVARGLANYHAKHQQELADRALAEYGAAKQRAEELAARPVSEIGGLIDAQVMNTERLDLLDEARASLGVALGRLEGTAALVSALETQEHGGAMPQELHVPLGAISAAEALAQARVLGLERPYVSGGSTEEADHRIDSDGVNKFLTVFPQGIERILRKPDPSTAEKSRAAAEIKAGWRDEKDWLPAGIVSRPRTSFDDPTGRPVEFTEPLELRPGMSAKQVRAAVEGYIARRLADGQAPESLRSDLLSAEFTADLPEDALGGGDGPYYAALRDLGWYTYEQAQNKSPEELERIAQKAVRDWERKNGASEEVAALNSQALPGFGTAQAYEALYRALAANPDARIAFKPLAELTDDDRGLIKDFFYRAMTTAKAPAEELREARLGARARGPAPKQEALWEMEPTEEPPGKKHGEGRRETPWNRYVKAHGSVQRAYESVQDAMRGAVVDQFARQIGAILGRPVKTGTQRIANWDTHLLGLVPPERQQQLLEAREAEQRSKQAGVATRTPGKFATEERAGIRRERAEALERAIRGAALSLFKESPLPAIDRPTLGRRAEKQLRSIFDYVGRNFDVRRPLEIPRDVNMSDGDMVKQQRAIKLIESQKRLSLNLGVGAGKTLVALGSFSELHSKGKVKRAIFAVPTSIVGQFGAEALRFYEPGRFRWFADPAATAQERRTAYADPSKHICVVTHQALRDDLIWAVAQTKFRGDTGRAQRWLQQSSEAERRDGIRRAVDRMGWNWDMALIDEGHDLLNRKGKPNSAMANALDALTADTPYYVSATADPVKNDASEVYDLLHKVAPDRYSDPEEFHRRYGIDCLRTQEALRQEMHPYAYAERVPAPVGAVRTQERVRLTPDEQAEYDDVLDAFRTAQAAKAANDLKRAIPALRRLSPGAFEGKSGPEQRAEARRMLRFLSAARDAALDRIVNTGSVRGAGVRAPAKLLALTKFVRSRAAEGPPGLIFAHSIDALHQIADHLRRNGLRVATLSGADAGDKRERTRQDFQAGKFQVLCLSDAGATGLNLQRAGFVVNYDSPYTAKTYEQRIGRMQRLGQENPHIEVQDLVSLTPYERRRRSLLEEKGKLREMLTAPYEITDDTDLGREIAEARSRELEAAALKAA